MGLQSEKFDEVKIDRLKKYLAKEIKNGRAKDYEISVDGFKIVPKTKDLTEFDDYETEIDNDTLNLSIVIYNSLKNNRNTVYSFYLGDEPPQEEKKVVGLGEIEDLVNVKVKEQVTAINKENEFIRLKEDLVEKDEKLDEAEIYIDKIENELIQVRQELEDLKRGKIKGLAKTGEAVGSMIFQNVLGNILKKLPGGEGIAGFLGANDDEQQTPGEKQEETTASFTMKVPKKEKAGEWDEYITLLDAKFSPKDRLVIIQIVETLSNETEKIETVSQLLNVKNS